MYKITLDKVKETLSKFSPEVIEKGKMIYKRKSAFGFYNDHFRASCYFESDPKKSCRIIWKDYFYNSLNANCFCKNKNCEHEFGLILMCIEKDYDVGSVYQVLDSIAINKNELGITMTSDDEKILDEIKKLCFSYKRNSYYSSSVKSVMDKIMAPFNKLSSKGKAYAIYFLALNFSDFGRTYSSYNEYDEDLFLQELSGLVMSSNIDSVSLMNLFVLIFESVSFSTLSDLRKGTILAVCGNTSYETIIKNAYLKVVLGNPDKEKDFNKITQVNRFEDCFNEYTPLKFVELFIKKGYLSSKSAEPLLRYTLSYGDDEMLVTLITELMNEDCLTKELKYEAKAFNRIYQNKLLSQKEIDTMVSKILKNGCCNSRVYIDFIDFLSMYARKEIDLYLIDNENVSTFVKLYEKIPCDKFRLTDCSYEDYYYLGLRVPLAYQKKVFDRISKLLDKFCDGKARDNDLINVKYSLLFMDKAYPEVCKAYLLKTEFRNNALKESTLIDSYFKLLDKYGLLIKLGYLPYGG